MRNPLERSKVNVGALIVLVLTAFIDSRGITYRRFERDNSCGFTRKIFFVTSAKECAGFCDIESSWCRGFAIGPVLDTGYRECLLPHKIRNYPATADDFVCYLNYETYKIATARNSGTSGVEYVAFGPANDSDIKKVGKDKYLSSLFPMWRPPVVDSVIYDEGEKCPDPNQVFLSVELNHPGIKEQRMECAAIVPPIKLLPDCYNVTIGPEFTRNFIRCLKYGILKEIYWYNDADAPEYPYRYTGGLCCNVTEKF